MGGTDCIVATASNVSQQVIESIHRLDEWLIKHDHKGYEPFDGLNSWIRPLAQGKLGRQVLQQGIKRLPWNLRPLLGIRPATSTKAIGYFARAHLKLYLLLGDHRYLQRAQKELTWLLEHPSPGFSGLSWGNHFDYQSRAFYLPKGRPTAVWTSLIGHAFLDAEALNSQPGYQEAINRICQFITTDLERRPEPPGACISYIPGEYHPVHNSNMLAAAVLARACSATGDYSLREVATQAITYTVERQHAGGSWWYGEASNFHWIDSWHTAYVLDSLYWFMKCTDNWDYHQAFRQGAAFWVSNFFLSDGTPRFYADRTYPIDIQAAAQAIETLCLLAEADDPACLDRARRVASWTINNMQSPDGHFFHQRERLWASKTPMLHWGQATMLHALSCLASLEARTED